MTFLLVALLLSSAPPVPTCQNKAPDPAALADLWEIESEFGVPTHRRGILGAIWCVESVWSPAGTFVWGDQGRALGPLQLHRGTAEACAMHADPEARGDQRTALDFSARCWLERVAALLPRAERYCGRGAAWDVAEAMVSAPGRYQWRCDARSKHVRLLEAWRASGRDLRHAFSRSVETVIAE